MSRSRLSSIVHPLEQADGLLLTLRIVLGVGSQGGLQHLLLHLGELQLLLEEPSLLPGIYGDAFSFHLSHQSPVPESEVGNALSDPTLHREVEPFSQLTFPVSLWPSNHVLPGIQDLLNASIIDRLSHHGLITSRRIWLGHRRLVLQLLRLEFQGSQLRWTLLPHGKPCRQVEVRGLLQVDGAQPPLHALAKFPQGVSSAIPDWDVVVEATLIFLLLGHLVQGLVLGEVVKPDASNSTCCCGSPGGSHHQLELGHRELVLLGVDASRRPAAQQRRAKAIAKTAPLPLQKAVGLTTLKQRASYPRRPFYYQLSHKAQGLSAGLKVRCCLHNLCRAKTVNSWPSSWTLYIILYKFSQRHFNFRPGCLWLFRYPFRLKKKHTNLALAFMKSCPLKGVKP